MTTDLDREMVATRQIYEALLPVKGEGRASIIKAVAVLLGVPGYWSVDKAETSEALRAMASAYFRATRKTKRVGKYPISVPKKAK